MEIVTKLLSECRFFDEGVETGLFAGGGVFLDDVFLDRLVEIFDRDFEFRLRSFYVARFHRFTSLLDSALHNAFNGLVSRGLSRGNAHVLLGGILDGHKRRMKNEE